MTDRIMLDIETLGLEPGCVILSIGACRFDHDGPTGEELYCELDIADCRGHGLTVDDETYEWWREQGERAPLDGETPLRDALCYLENTVSGADELWANSPKFDMAILEAAYDAVGLDAPWAYHELRDVRTLRALPAAVELEMEGREHHALDDARHQAREVAATLQSVALGVFDD